jgi:NitT/TauT family transport system permease protein
MRPAWLAPSLVGCGILGAWEAGARLLHVSTAILVPPSAIVASAGAHPVILLHHMAITAAETIEGFVLAAGLGVLLAALIASSAVLRRMLMPWLLIVQIVPKIALAPLFIVWLGTGTPCRMVFTVFLALFPVTVAGVAGLLSADRNVLLLYTALRASRLQQIVRVRLPYALPHLFVGLKVAATMVLLGVTIGEFVTAQGGLGYIILFASSIGETALMFAALVLLCLIGLALYAAVAVAEQVYARWFGVPSPDAAELAII